MAIKLPLVITSGVIQQLQPGDSLDTRAEQFQLVNDEATPVVIGAPVYDDAAGGFKKAQANAASTKDVVGLVGQAPSIANGVTGAISLDGILTATTTQWDAVVTGGSGGLVFKTRYYLDPATAGKLTTTAPSTVGQYVCEVGIAISTVDMKINVMPPILL
jgi:hypothetical protein